MSIYTLDLRTFKQNFDCKKENKERYGEVNTDFNLINQMLDLLPRKLFTNPKLKWLDPCAGQGYFPMVLYQRLFKSLQTKIKAPKKRHEHIIKNMIYMIEINGEHIPCLYSLFGENANIAHGDFLTSSNMKFDIILGNPPFNANGTIKVPTQKGISKKKDGVSIWADFVKNSIANLKSQGWLAMITPSIWMKRDHSFHNYLHERGQIDKLKCMTNTETNTIFHKQAQTPTSFFAFQKSTTNNRIKLYDSNSKTYICCNELNSLPLISPKIIKKLNEYVKKVGYINVIKTSMRPGYKGLSVSKVKDKQHPHSNISTCILDRLKPKLVINYSNRVCSHHSTSPKLVLAHKMYGFPYLDMKGYGISNRDNYIIKEYSLSELVSIKKFLTTRLAFVIFEATRYRMKYLERYAFEFLPDITKLDNFPEEITDENVATYFELDDEERKYIQNFNKKNYSECIDEPTIG